MDRSLHPNWPLPFVMSWIDHSTQTGPSGLRRVRASGAEECQGMAVFEPGADAPGSNTASYTLSEGLILTQEYT